MQYWIHRFILILSLSLFACNSNYTSEKPKHERKFDCSSLTDKKVILEIANSIVAKHDNDQIWNLNEIDTSDFFTVEDFFTNSKTKNRLVFVGGFAGGSAGSADNLLILFSCSDTFNIVWAGQVGEFSQADIADLNGDGIMEITMNPGAIWMGECFDTYEIFNLKDGKQNFLFAAHSTSVIDCGRDDLSEIYKPGDTLESKFDCSLQKTNDDGFEVKQIHTIKVHNGGQTDEEILRSLRTTLDTTNIKLK